MRISEMFVKLRRHYDRPIIVAYDGKFYHVRLCLLVDRKLDDSSQTYTVEPLGSAMTMQKALQRAMKGMAS